MSSANMHTQTASLSPRFAAYAASEPDSSYENKNTTLPQTNRPIDVHRRLMSPSSAPPPTNYSYPFTNIRRKPFQSSHARNGATHGKIQDQTATDASKAPGVEGYVASTVTIIPTSRLIVREQEPASTASLRGSSPMALEPGSIAEVPKASSSPGGVSSSSSRSSLTHLDEGKVITDPEEGKPATWSNASFLFPFLSADDATEDDTMVHLEL
ncbi:hypothetical protein Cpir12675_004375 [Ceratocystis pirilliformis]|uniref:Uncharacterized protein n=1 Tax=Ceratocystis pirilliformis TaxID=259994 RepID=A0ABR3YY55_9PEZI